MANKEWQSHPGTQAYLRKLYEDRDSIKEGWANGEYTTESIDGTVQLNSKNIGKAEAIQEMIEYIEGDEEIEEQNEPDAYM